MSMLGIVTCLC